MSAGLAQALAAGRREAEALMLDSCTIRRVVDVLTDADGNDIAVYESVYAGRCKVQTYEPYERSPESGGRTVVVQRYSVHVPVGAGPFLPGDVITITASRFATHAVGATYRVAGLHEKTFQTAQRLLVDEEVT